MSFEMEEKRGKSSTKITPDATSRNRGLIVLQIKLFGQSKNEWGMFMIGSGNPPAYGEPMVPAAVVDAKVPMR